MMGGIEMIRVESIRIVETNQSFCDIFHALFVMDMILSDGRLHDDFNITEKDTDIILAIFIDKKLDLFDHYIQMVVKAFINNKKQITLNMNGLSKITHNVNGKRIVDLIIENGVKHIKAKYNISWRNILWRENLITTNVFDMLPSTTNIIINMGGMNWRYIFDLFAFLEIISKSDSWKMVEIKEMVWTWDKNKSWLYSYYHSCQFSLKSKCQKYGFHMEFKSIQIQEGYFDGCLVISRV